MPSMRPLASSLLAGKVNSLCPACHSLRSGYPRTGRRRLEAARWRLNNAAGRRVYGFANAARSPITDKQRNALAQGIAGEDLRVQQTPAIDKSQVDSHTEPFSVDSFVQPCVAPCSTSGEQTGQNY
jgi:hypothetical protein